jgi:tellurite resistance protein
MISEHRIQLLAKLAQARSEPGLPAAPGKPGERSILTLAAASYGAKPDADSTIPTGFDPHAAALFESIVEGAYLVATADGVFDEEERRTFERVVTAACGGTVPQGHIEGLVADLSDQLAEDGVDARLARLAEPLTRVEHAREVLRIAALLARCSDDVSATEREMLEKLAAACKLDPSEVDRALEDVDVALR